MSPKIHVGQSSIDYIYWQVHTKSNLAFLDLR